MTDKQKEDNDKWSGTIELNKDDIVFKSQGKELIRLSLANIKVIGEMTTAADPMANDWYLIFVDKNNEPYYIPAYANEMESFQKQLGEKLNSIIVCRLFSSIDFDSNIIYPNEFAGQKLFDFKEEPPKNLWEKIGKFLGLGRPIIPELTEEVKKYKNNI